jgi:hypothetical protein
MIRSVRCFGVYAVGDGQLAEGNDLLLLRVAQEIGHGGVGSTVPGAASMS